MLVFRSETAQMAATGRADRPGPAHRVRRRWATRGVPSRAGEAAARALVPVAACAVLIAGVLGLQGAVAAPDAGASTAAVATWTQLLPTSSPSARWDATIADDSATTAMVLFGGDSGSGNLGDTWSFDGSNWTQLFPTTSPSARRNAAMAYDPATGTTILFGGWSSSNLGDTWSFDGSNWTQLFPTTSPSARHLAAMAYDPATGTMILFGGFNGTSLGDTWSFDGSNWTQLSPTTSPPAR